MNFELDIIENKYSGVTDELKMLQISNNSIIESIIEKMLGKEEFIDTTTNGDIIYSSTIFEQILDETSNSNQVSKKMLVQLNELVTLCKNYNYVMVINNPQ